MVKVADLESPRTRTYRVAYRVSTRSTAGGSQQERYDELVRRLTAMQASSERRYFEDPGHISTSTWLVQSTEESAEKLLRHLKGTLTPGNDLLEVVEVIPGNAARLT